MTTIQHRICEHNSHVPGAPTAHTSGSPFATIDSPGGVDDCRLTLLLLVRLLLALVTIVLMLCLALTIGPLVK
jgi:hypothetical protein